MDDHVMVCRAMDDHVKVCRATDDHVKVCRVKDDREKVYRATDDHDQDVDSSAGPGDCDPGSDVMDDRGPDVGTDADVVLGLDVDDGVPISNAHELGAVRDQQRR